MENPTAFDLNQAVQSWRAEFTESSVIQVEKLDELESHLRDSVSQLQTRGLSSEEAFIVATRRLGQPAALEVEFGKANPKAVWLGRLFWMVLGVQIWVFIQLLCNYTVWLPFEILSRKVALSHGAMPNYLSYQTLSLLFSIGSFLAPLAVLFTASRCLSQRHLASMQIVLRKLQQQPALLALSFFLVCSSTDWIGRALRGLIYQSDSNLQFQIPPNYYLTVFVMTLCQFGALACITFFVARLHLKAAKA